MIQPFRVLLLVVALLIGTPPLLAEQPIGYIKTLTGPSALIVSRGGSERSAQIGGQLHLGDTVRTGRGTALGLTLKDDTMMSVGPDTEMTLEEFLFEPARGDLRLGSRLGRGTLQFVSGSIARLQPDAVKVETPTGTIGVRGTHFVVRVGR